MEQNEQREQKSFSEWYEENSDEWNAQRRKRYEEDEEYREKVKQWNANARARRREARLAKRRERQTSMVAVTSDPGWKREEIDGVGEGFTLGALAALTGKSVKTLRLWEKKGIIPETPYRDASGSRLYTREKLDEIVEDLLARGLVNEDEKVRVRSKTTPDYCLVKRADGTKEWLRLYRISMVADVMERTVSTVNRLERQGYFPATSLRTPARNQRRYTFEQIQAISDVWHEFGYTCRGKRWHEFRSQVEARWEAQGIMGARVCFVEPSDNTDETE